VADGRGGHSLLAGLHELRVGGVFPAVCQESGNALLLDSDQFIVCVGHEDG
jgi:hypothetical protein